MSVRFLSTRAHALLLASINDNRDAYLAGRASSAPEALGRGSVHESKIEAGPPPKLVLPNGDTKHDEQNIRNIHRWLGHLTPLQASDSRLWTCLTHSSYSDYTAIRWPIDPESEVENRIRERYFMEGEGLSSITRNSIARLWWFGHLVFDATRPDPYELADVLVSLQDMQQAFLERTIGRSRRLLRTALRLWKHRIEQGAPPAAQGRVIQKWARLIRLHGGVVLLDTLPDARLESLLWVKLASALNEDLPELEKEEPL